MGKYNDFYQAREKILNIVSEDLLGPVHEDEIINEPPTSYYIMGKLYPKTAKGVQVDENTSSTELESIDAEESLSSTNVREPRAMGITFTVKPNIETVNISVKYAFYKSYTLEEAKAENLSLERYKAQIDAADEKAKGRMVFWKRMPKAIECNVSCNDSSSIEIEAGIFLKSFLHKVADSGDKIITTVLTNERETFDEDRNIVAANSVLQPELIVTSSDASYPFTEVGRQVEMTTNEELVQLDMLYSQNRCYAQGHGCSVVWDLENEEPLFIKSAFIPTYNLQQMKAAEIKDNPVFNMKYLFSADKTEVISNLRSFANMYADWIARQEIIATTEKYVNYHAAAESNIKSCRKILERINHSIDLLADSENDFAWRAFRYANEAMYMQRCKTIEKGSGKDAVDPDKINWYPFQLAFIILEVSSFVEPNSENRKIVDLLWFPTGGGKTEAYLGIAAFEIFYRRLTNPDSCNGVTVIMRYTLRLLTIQQFERASMLICSCELLRIKYGIPGDEISIGLWVGNNFTPGTIEQADSVLTKILSTGQISHDDTDPCQVKICPWCGEKLHPIHYSIHNSKKRMVISCPNEKCDFHKKPLPVRLIDEEIYEYRPTFIVATVDKFAQIAIQEKTAALFSNDDGNLPPELIIQDELHLISGPLGTMTGIYEAAITHICEKKGRVAKVVASTATIRNASNQILALYGREYNQFPPQGLSADDSFFAVKATADEKPARFYAGIMGVGTTFTTTLIRVYAAWLFASRYLVDLGYDDAVVDNFWTMTGYFNSIRELGATQTQIVDDIQSRYRYLKESKFKERYKEFSGDDKYELSVELTSRMSNDEISKVIQEDLKRPYERENHDEVYDFVLASNMISVGVDVGRLGLMAVAGQSKTNAEYIQATSRVGRTNPGLVFTVYNGNRSRDRSHYEQFSRYHSALYRYVEATSLTPFSDRARDRGLQALFVTLCRYYCPELLSDNAAGNFRMDLSGVKKVEQIIYRYVDIVDTREKESVLAELKDIERKWEERALEGPLWYRKKDKPSLLQPDTEDDRFRIMNSMRSVETESGIYLVGEFE